eukprot:COSAG06_NODE_22483_length_722_cov_0.833066_1_plen_29_part_01
MFSAAAWATSGAAGIVNQLVVDPATELKM